MRLSWLTRIRPSFGETMQGQRYTAGQQFKPHHDFFYTDQAYWPELERNGGQRTWTAMMFLNATLAGGETFFPRVGAKARMSTRLNSSHYCASRMPSSAWNQANK